MVGQQRRQFLAEVVRRITDVVPARSVILFGSWARGENTADSDVDLLILLDELDNPRRESVRIRRALRGLGQAFDIVVMSTERFNETRDVIGDLSYPASHEGDVLFEVA
jgi:predicted nucleotidyltransferase